MTSSNPDWDTRLADTSIHDLMRIEYEELVGGAEGEMGLPDDVLSPPSGFYALNQRRKHRRAPQRPKKFIPFSLDEIEGRIK